MATLMFALELERRARAANWPLMSNAAHPGFARTELQTAGPRMGREGRRGLSDLAMTVLFPLASQSAAAGALPTLYAATAPEAEGGVLYGPDGFYELKGAPKKAKIVPAGLDQTVWQRLREVSERLTGVILPLALAA
jgi:hypothetical protein